MATGSANPAGSVDIIIARTDGYVMDIASSALIIKEVEVVASNEYRLIDPQTGEPSQNPNAVRQFRVSIITEWKDVN